MKLSAEIVRILALPEIRERLLGLGAEPVGNSPEQFAAFLREDIARWAKVVKDAKIPLQSWSRRVARLKLARQLHSAYRVPQFRRRERHIQMPDAKRAQRVDGSIDERGQ